MSYFEKSIDADFYTEKGFYIFHIPVKVPYKSIYANAEKAGFKLKQKFGPILESGKMFGFGWIGVEIEKKSGEAVKHIQGTFTGYEYIGPYNKIGSSYKKIFKEKPGHKKFYNLYIDNPNEVAEEKLRTHILFK